MVRGKPESALIAEQLIRKIITEQSAIQTFEMMIPQWAIGKIIGEIEHLPVHPPLPPHL